MLHEPFATEAPRRFSYNPDNYIVVEGHRDHTEMTERRTDGEPSPLAGTMLPAMIEGGYQGSIFVLGGDGDHHRAGSQRPLEGSFDVMDLFFNEIKKAPHASIVLNKRDLPERPQPGKMHFIIEIEGGHPFQEDYSSGLKMERRLHLFRTFFRLGMRHMHISHQGRNELADGHDDDITGGRLSEFGVAVVKEANRLGVTMTLGHLSEPCLFHVLEVSQQPVLNTHSNAAALVPHKRNNTDAQLKAIAAQGGVVGVHFLSMIQNKNKPNLDELVDHIEYMSGLIGPEHVGFGILNRDPGYVKWKPNSAKDLICTTDQPGGVSYRRGLEMLIERLDRRGFSETAVRGILGGNYLRVFRQNLPEDSPVYWNYRA
jgi:membrane dipeptidase